MLYSVREACARDLEGTLREVAGMGFEGVEVHDLFGRTPQDFAGLLAACGLEACGRHARLKAIEDDLPALAAEARALGHRRLVVSWVHPNELGDDTLRRLAGAGEAVRQQGLELGYHNHDAEVRDGFLERLPEGVFVELDAGWAWWAGADPVELLGRGPLVHIKDFRERGTRSFCPVGDGAVGYERVAPAAVRAGAEWLVVEQDEADGSEVDAARRSLQALRRMLEAVA